ncbi:hypothetical protein GCK72_003287 [Caenorhabditis remanei]|uniref:Uncharacterized protein n=1 Tax=Caenorhabditis remanei TaxID=31234 RepID=A0A6A5HW39_CAERE|nr:hypothetical protein GCK72_003287 [Caenorhabditis remanei]KAF1771461.1 hypothetical protein GCK72_003287 [Caenorhabditis remanei]
MSTHQKSALQQEVVESPDGQGALLKEEEEKFWKELQTLQAQAPPKHQVEPQPEEPQKKIKISDIPEVVLEEDEDIPDGQGILLERQAALFAAELEKQFN